MAGGYGQGSGVPLRDRIRAGQPATLAPGVGAEAVCPGRHCWVSVPVDEGPPRPGLLLQWRRDLDVSGMWVGLVIYPAQLRPGEWAAVTEWLSADRLTATPPSDG